MEILGGGSVPERDKRDAKMAGRASFLTPPTPCRGWQYNWKTWDWGLYVLFSRVEDAVISGEIFL